MARSHRRAFLEQTAASLMALPLAGVRGKALPAQTAKGDRSPTRKPLVLDVRDFGAAGNGTTKDTSAIQQALDRCGVLGGGDLRLSPGNYLTGALALRTGTTLRLEDGATLSGTPDFADYPVTQVRWEGKWIRGHVGLLFEIDARRVAVVGPGRIVGHPALGGRPTAQNPLRHPALIEPIGCDEKGIAIANVRNATIRGIAVTGVEGPLISTYNVTGRGLGNTATLPAPRLPDPVTGSPAPYVLR